MSNVNINVDRRTEGRTDGQKIGRLYRTLLQAGAIISDKDIFKTHLREVYIMMILCDTEIRTYILLKKGQTTVARKKVGLPTFSCRTSKFEE